MEESLPTRTGMALPHEPERRRHAGQRAPRCWFLLQTSPALGRGNRARARQRPRASVRERLKRKGSQRKRRGAQSGPARERRSPLSSRQTQPATCLSPYGILQGAFRETQCCSQLRDAVRTQKCLFGFFWQFKHHFFLYLHANVSSILWTISVKLIDLYTSNQKSHTYLPLYRVWDRGKSSSS